MELLNNFVSLLSHVAFIAMTHQILRETFDWARLIKNPSQNVGRLKVFILFLSIAIGYLVSHFILEIITTMQSIFFAIQ